MAQNLLNKKRITNFVELKRIYSYMLETEYQYYLRHQSELQTRYSGRFIVIVGESVVGDYGSKADAYLNSVKKYDLGTFLIQECNDGNTGYTQTYHSRVIFA